MNRLSTALAVGTGSLALLLASPAGAATANQAPAVVDREIVQAELTPSGAVDAARLVSQLTVVGNGHVLIADPTSGRGLRNLDGFSTPTMRDGRAIYSIDVHGVTQRRTVSDFTKQLPVTVAALYRLNGRIIQAKDLVGKSGLLEVAYTVTNVSGTPTVLTWKDGAGATHTRTIDLVTPYVGQVKTVLPASFSSIDAPRADVAGNGRGGALLAWSMVLFQPLGEQTQTFGYSAHVTDAQLPPTTVEVVPASPTKKPELAVGVAGYKAGAAQAAQLTQGASLIDGNLLKLQSGAGQLLGGLTQLAAGAASLRNGLSTQLAPGAAKLAAGAAKAKAGSQALQAGADKIATGSGALLGGITTAANGSSDLAAGLTTADDGAAALADGIGQILAGVQSLPTDLQADPDYQALLGALTQVKAGIGTATDATPTTLLGGLNLLGYGLRSPLGVGGCNPAAAPGTATACGAADAVQLVQTQLAAAAASGGQLDQLIGAAQAGYASALCPAPPVPVPVAGVLPPTTPGLTPTCLYLSSLAYGLALPAGLDPAHLLGGVKAQTGLAASTLLAVYQGIDNGVLPGMNLIKLGLSNPACDLTDPTNPANPCGIYQVQSLVAGGISALVAQISAQLSAVLADASTGADALAAGVSQLAAGGNDLAGGLGQLQAGSQQLADGATAAATGAGSLANGLDQLASGSSQLSHGISRATVGADQLAAGLVAAKSGDAKVVSGAGQLRSQGTSALVAAGNEAASSAAEKYATLLALSDKVQSGALPYGAPEGATGTAAYRLTLAAANSQNRDNAARGLLAFALISMALAVSWLTRRRLAR